MLRKEFCFLTFIMILFLLASCLQENTGKVLSKTDLVKFISKKNNGLVKEEDVHGIHIKLLYQPTSLLVSRELEPGQEQDTALVGKLEQKYDDHYYFILKFARNGKEVIRQLGGFSRYSDMLQVFSFDMNRFVNLTTPEKDTIPLGDFFYDQQYGMSDGNSILLSFDKKQLQGKSSIDINVAECGLGTGNLKFRFDSKHLEKVPRLDYNSI